MATFNKAKLSGSTDGMAIKVTGTGTGSTVTVHTAVAGTTAGVFDEIWLYANNTSSSAVKLTIEWGGVSSPDDLIELSIAAESGLVLVSPGLVIKGNATPLVVRAFAATTNVINIAGYVNRITV